MNSVQIKVLTTLALLTSIVGCSHTPLTPSQTVQHFWSAVISGDLENAKQYSTENSNLAIKDLQKDMANKELSFGKVSLQSDRAKIETTISNGETRSATFNTVLDKPQEIWKVNIVETKKSLEKSKDKKGLNKLVDELHKFGRDFSGQLDDALKNWDESKPKLKKDLEGLGESVQKRLQDSIEKHGPELQRNLQEFTESIDKALEELEKSLPEEKKDDDSQDPKARMI